MRPAIKARELWLFIPFLLIGAGAFYWQRVEQVSKPGARGMYVSDFRIEAAPGYWREKGYSHQVEVVVSHPWPRPKWWGQQFGMQLHLYPLQPEKEDATFDQFKRDQFVEGGAVLTIKQGGKVVPWPRQSPHISYDARFDGSDYVFEHRIKGSEIPKALGAVTFRGLYRIADTKLLPVTREVRKAGASLPMSGDKNPGAQLIAVDSTPFEARGNTAGSSKPTKEDNGSLQFRVRDGQTPPSKAEDSRLVVYDIELQDEQGKIIGAYSTNDFIQGTTGFQPDPAHPLPADEKRTGVFLSLEQALKTTGHLTLRGKVSLDERWPLPFKVLLPPRQSKPSVSDRANPYSIPLWRDGKPLKIQ